MCFLVPHGSELVQLGASDVSSSAALIDTPDSAGGVSGTIAEEIQRGIDRPVSFSSICDATGIPEDMLKRILHSLSQGKYKILHRISNVAATPEETEKSRERSEKGKGSSSAIRTTDLFSVNERFSASLRKFRIPMASVDDSNSEKRVEEDRSNAIEAAVVRIMKVLLMIQSV
jgi:hypothetical protein